MGILHVKTYIRREWAHCGLCFTVGICKNIYIDKCGRSMRKKPPSPAPSVVAVMVEGTKEAEDTYSCI